MNNKLVSLLLLVGTAIGLSACGGGNNGSGGGGGGGGNGSVYPPPNPAQGTYVYNGKSYLYTALPQPNITHGGVLTKSYPSSYLPNGLSNSLQIAYGYNDDVKVAGIAALVTMVTYYFDINNNLKEGLSICSATPVKYDESSNTTFLIGAAHCFVKNKTDARKLTDANIYAPEKLKVFYGKNIVDYPTEYNVKAVYLPTSYCYNAKFESGYSCPNFEPNDGVKNGQGNDIAIIQIESQFASAISPVYPEVVESSQYPDTYTMAPILSIGYGISTQTPVPEDTSCTMGSTCAKMFYVANYQYTASLTTNTGYQYLYNSFYNNNQLGIGYTALVCGGDSGGGDLFWTGNKWILLSEHTYGPGDACGTFYDYLPNAATNVSAYYDWIMNIMNSPDPVATCRSSSANCVTNAL